MNTVLSGATVHTITGEVLVGGEILIGPSGKIREVAEEVSPPKKYELIELRQSWHITPTLIDAHSHIGLTGEYGQDECNDYSEPISPGLSIIDSYYFDNHDVDLCLESGVGASCILPGSGSVIGGKGAVIKMLRKPVKEILVNEFCGIKASICTNSSNGVEFDSEVAHTKMGITSRVRDFFHKVSLYSKNKKADNIGVNEHLIHYDTLVEVMAKKIPIRVHCHSARDIELAIRLFHDELGMNIILEHATRADEVIDMISDRNIPIVYGPYPLAMDGYMKKMNLNVPKIIHDNGIKMAFMTDHDVIPGWTLQTVACEAVKRGLSKSAALEAMTINAASICGISDRLGSIEKGKDADLVIWDKNPLNFYAKPLAVMIEGRFEYIEEKMQEEFLSE